MDEHQAYQALKNKLADRNWRLNHLYYIKDKQGNKVLLKFNWAQKSLYKALWYFNVILKARQLGFCLDPETRILTADLQWIRIEDVKIGQEIVAVDEYATGGRGKQRKIRTGTVQGVVEVYRDAYEIEFDNGLKIVCTGQHPWLGRKVATDCHWMNILGSEGRKRIRIGDKIRSITKPWKSSNYEDGWFGGIIDGEGSMALPKSSGAEVNVAQRDGVVWERIKKYLSDNGYNYRIESDNRVAGTGSKFGNSVVHKACISRMDEIMRLVGKTRPSRMIGKHFWEGKELPGKRVESDLWRTVVNIKPLGKRRLIDLQTSTGTYIAEGFVSHNTTFILIYFLDSCLFNSNQSAGVIAHTKDDAEDLFDNKVKFAYDNLPDFLKSLITANTDSAKKLVFSNGSSFTVGTSLRSGTYQKLLISEYGKVSAKYPDKAREIKTGALNTVEQGQQIFVESTAEGKGGEFFDLCEHARKLAAANKQLTRMEPKFHFYAWYDNPDYRLSDEETAHIVIPKELKDKLSALPIDANQAAWYAAKASIMHDDMRREYPSTPEEAFEGSLDGAYYTKEMDIVRKNGQICTVPYDRRYPVSTFWDIGQSRDQMSIIFAQDVNGRRNFINYHESNDQGWDFYAKLLASLDYNYEQHVWPHDGNKRIVGQEILTSRQIAEKVGIKPIKIIPVTKSVSDDIRDFCKPILPVCWFDEEKCSLLIKRLDNYRRRWDNINSMWLTDAVHDENSHGADAFRTYAKNIKTPKEKPLVPKIKPVVISQTGIRRGGNWMGR